MVPSKFAAEKEDSSEPVFKRIHRLLTILWLVQSGRGWNAVRLAEYCEVTVRTIYRDLRVLKSAGIPCDYDPESGGYRIRGDFYMKPVDLTFQEMLALIALGERIGGQNQVPFTRAAVQAVAKLRLQLPAALRRELEAVEQHIWVRLAAASPPDSVQDVFDKVQRAIAERRVLRCSYEPVSSSEGEKDDSANRDFFFRPYALFFSQRAWYAVGWHEKRKAIRSLKLNRFDRIELTDQHYTIPRNFSLQEHLGYAWRMIRGRPRYQVELEFDAEFGDTIAETQWHVTQDTKWEGNKLIFRCTVDGLEEIVWWVLSMGPHCRVRAPEELAQKVRELAAQTAALYGEEARGEGDCRAAGSPEAAQS